jgi:UDP-3-O-[3-hydroxymyristoyl] glucosamine N-acyltransferase
MDFSLGEIAEVINAELIGDPECLITGVGSLGNASTHHLSFLANPRYTTQLKATKAAAVIISIENVDDCPAHSLVCKEPYLAYIKAVRYMNPIAEFHAAIHPSAVIEETAIVNASAYIGANTYIANNVQIKDRVQIGAGCVIEDNVIIGSGSRLHANVTVCHNVCIGDRVLLHPGVVVGSDGFGLANDAGVWLKVPQLGSVEIMDDVEIGSNSAIDRGALDNTRIEAGVKIDNLVQIGHNVLVGAHTAIAGCAAIAGSVTIGKRCMIGGGTCIAGHNTIADDVVITGLSGVTNSIKQAGTYSGAMTTTDNKRWRKNMARFRHLDELVRRISELEDKLLKIKLKQD